MINTKKINIKNYTNRVQNLFDQHPAFVGFVYVGDGGLETSYQMAIELIDSGVDIIEIAVPFSDPMADGPTIQQAALRSLAAGTTPDDVLGFIARVRNARPDVGLVLFSYYQPLLCYGLEDYLTQAKIAGVDGCLIVDLPLEEADEYLEICQHVAIDPILLLSPSTPMERVVQIAARGRGMLYYACRNGVTGVKQQLPDGFAEKLADIKACTSLPVVAGFGIANRDTARAVLAEADGFVVASKFIDAQQKRLDISDIVKSIDPR